MRMRSVSPAIVLLGLFAAKPAYHRLRTGAFQSEDAADLLRGWTVESACSSSSQAWCAGSSHRTGELITPNGDAQVAG